MTSLSVTWWTNELAGHHAEVCAGMRKSRDRWSMSGMRAPYIQQMEWRTSLPETITFLPSAPRGSHICKWLPSFSLYIHLRRLLEFSVKDCLVVCLSQLSSIHSLSLSFPIYEKEEAVKAHSQSPASLLMRSRNSMAMAAFKYCCFLACYKRALRTPTPALFHPPHKARRPLENFHISRQLHFRSPGMSWFFPPEHTPKTLPGPPLPRWEHMSAARVTTRLYVPWLFVSLPQKPPTSSWES